MVIKNLYKDKIELLIPWSMSFYIILLGLNSLVNKVIGNTPFDSYALSLVYAIIAVQAAIDIFCGHLDIRCMAIYMIMGATVHIGANIYDLSNIAVYNTVIFFIVGYSLERFDRLEKYMDKCCIAAACFAIIYVVFSIVGTGYVHDMVAAYSFLPMAVYSVYLAIYRKGIIYKFLSVISGIIIFIFATRGPMFLYILGAFIICLKYFLETKTIKKIFMFLVFAACIAFLVVNHEAVMRQIGRSMDAYGMDNGIINRFLNDSLADDNGRNMLKEIANRKISENMFFGYGCFSDRKYLNTYCHSLYTELWMDFGIFFGTLILVFYLWRAFRLLMMNRKNDFTFAFLIAVYSVAIGKLFLSGSYLEQGEFFLVLGFLLKKKNFKRQEASMINEENIDSERKLGEC